MGTAVVVAREGDRHIDIARIDAAWNETVGRDPLTGDDDVLLDFSGARYIDQECLLYLIALIDLRYGEGKRTVLGFPDDPRIVDFLRAWGFPEALATVSGERFEAFLTEATRKRFAEVAGIPPRYVSVATTPEGGRESLLPVDHFALTPIALSENPSSAASIVRSKWLSEHVVQVLDKLLGGYGHRVASHLLYEGVLNAASHPRASIAYTSAQLLSRRRPSDTEAKPRELVVAIWDDGLSFADTLLQTYREHGTIASPAFGLIEEKFDLSIVDRRTGANSRDVISTADPVGIDSEPELFVAAFFLGITSVPHFRRANGEAVLDDVEAPATWLPGEAANFGGLGLHLIRKAVIDLFNGSLYYVSGGFRVAIRRGNDANNYRAWVVRRDDRDPQVKGNLLIARMSLLVDNDGG